MKIYAFNWNLYKENPELINTHYFSSKEKAENEHSDLIQKAISLLPKHGDMAVMGKFSKVYEIEVED